MVESFAQAEAGAREPRLLPDDFDEADRGYYASSSSEVPSREEGSSLTKAFKSMLPA